MGALHAQCSGGLRGFLGKVQGMYDVSFKSPRDSAIFEGKLNLTENPVTETWSANLEVVELPVAWSDHVLGVQMEQEVPLDVWREGREVWSCVAKVTSKLRNNSFDRSSLWHTLRISLNPVEMRSLSQEEVERYFLGH